MTDTQHRPTVAVVGDDGTVRRIAEALSGDDTLRVETTDADGFRPSDSLADCVVTDDHKLLESLGGDTDISVVYVSDAAADASDAADAGAVETVELPPNDPEMFRRRVRRYAQAGRYFGDHESEPRSMKRRYEAFFRDPNVLIGVLDTDGTLLDANPKSMEYIDAEIEDVIGKTFWETPWWGEEGKDLIMENVRRAAEGEYVEYEVEHVGPRTEEYVSKGYVRPVTDESGEVTSVIVSSHDITERKKRERELRRSREEYRQLINSMNDEAFVIDDDGNFLEVNDAAVESLGYSREELLSMSPNEIDAGLEEDKIDNLITSMPEDEVQVFETIHETKGGEEIPVEVSSSLITFEGKEAILSIARDITHRKEYERELERSRELLRSTERISDTGGWEVDLETEEQRWTEGTRRIHGVDEEYKPTVEAGIGFYHPDDRERIGEAVRNCRENGEPFDEELRIITDDGETRWVRALGEPVKEDGEITKLRGAIQDITERKEREQELRLKTQAMDGAPIGITIADSDGRDNPMIYVNEAFSELTGYSEDEALGRDCRFLQGDETAEEPVAEMRRSIDNEEPTTVELRNYRKDGEMFWNRVTVAPVRDDDGEVTDYVGFQEDVTERKERERELERYEELWQNIPVGVCRVRADDGGEFLRANKRLIEMTGADSEDELLEHTTDDFWTDEGEREELLERIEENGWVTRERRFRNLDGRMVWARVTVVRHDATDGVVLDAIVQDITDRRQREEQMKEAEEVADMGSWHMNLSSDVIYWSDRVYNLLGVDGEGAMHYDTFLEDYVYPDDEEYLDRKWQEAKEGEPYDIEYRIIRGDGGVRWMREAAEITFENGEPVSATGVIQDITERKEHERDLENRKEQIEFFNSLLRHEMLNSMTVIRGSTRTILDRLSEDDEMYEVAERVYDRSDQVVALINRVRSVLDRISGEARELNDRNLSETVRDRVASLERSYDVETSVDVPDEAYVEADDFLDDIVDNVLDNAVEHNDKDEPQVEITVEKGPENVVLRIADNGPGIPDDRKEDVFKQGVTGKTGGALGFGLYFVESMVSEYGGEVYVEDNQPEGAVVVIELPNSGRGI